MRVPLQRFREIFEQVVNVETGTSIVGGPRCQEVAQASGEGYTDRCVQDVFMLCEVLLTNANVNYLHGTVLDSMLKRGVMACEGEANASGNGHADG